MMTPLTNQPINQLIEAVVQGALESYLTQDSPRNCNNDSSSKKAIGLDIRPIQPGVLAVSAQASWLSTTR